MVADGPPLPDRFPAVAAVTNPELFYVRFYGRNARGWRSHKTAERFDYSYSEEELRECIEGRIERLGRCARTGVLFFANHIRGQAPKNALRMMALLREKGMAVV